MARRHTWSLALAGVMTTTLLTASPSAVADGTETLGEPSVPINEADQVAVAGVGTHDQPAELVVAIPADATVEQVLLYWNGTVREGEPADTTIEVDGIFVEGDIIGGPTYFFGSNPRKDSVAVRADITALDLVGPGTSELTIDGMAFDHQNNGAGLIATYSDGSGSDVFIRDGLDIAYERFSGDRMTTVPQTIEFTPSLADRTIDLHVSVGSVGEDRPHRMDVTIDGVTTQFEDPIVENGPEFGVAHVSVPVPAGADSATVQMLSVDDGNSASLEWVNLAATLPPAVVAHCTGHAFDVRLDLTGVASGFFGPLVETDPDVFPDQDTASELAITVPGDTDPVVTAVTLQAENSGTPMDTCVTRMTYEDLGVDLNNLGPAPGLPVTLTVKAVESIATAQGLPVTTTSDVTIVDGVLTIMGNAIPIPVKPPPNSTLVDETVASPLGTLSVKVVLHETTDIEVGGEKVGVAVNAVRVQVEVIDLAGTVTQTADLRVAHAEADVEEG